MRSRQGRERRCVLVPLVRARDEAPGIGLCGIHAPEVFGIRLFVRRPAGASAGLSEFASTPAAPSIPHMMLAAETPSDWNRSRRDMGKRSRTITSECKELYEWETKAGRSCSEPLRRRIGEPQVAMA